jgi:acetyl esterase/lipase
MWEQGGVAELHAWPGAFHGFDVLVPDANISRRAVLARLNWLRRLLET